MVAAQDNTQAGQADSTNLRDPVNGKSDVYSPVIAPLAILAFCCGLGVAGASPVPCTLAGNITGTIDSSAFCLSVTFLRPKAMVMQ